MILNSDNNIAEKKENWYGSDLAFANGMFRQSYWQVCPKVTRAIMPRATVRCYYIYG